jgi:hypothetical protein
MIGTLFGLFGVTVVIASASFGYKAYQRWATKRAQDMGCRHRLKGSSERCGWTVDEGKRFCTKDHLCPECKRRGKSSTAKWCDSCQKKYQRRENILTSAGGTARVTRANINPVFGGDQGNFSTGDDLYGGLTSPSSAHGLCSLGPGGVYIDVEEDPGGFGFGV